MSESPKDNPPHFPIADPGTSQDGTAGGAVTRRRIGLWLVAALSLSAALVVALVVLFPGRSREEEAAIEAAVAQYAELYREPPGGIYKYGKIRTEKLAGGDWRVNITRFVIPDNASDFGITSIFRVGRDGACEYVGQKVGHDR